jgi:hypothetical protein
MGKVCETCGQTRWEARQVDGYLTALREENDRLRSVLGKLLQEAAVKDPNDHRLTDAINDAALLLHTTTGDD